MEADTDNLQELVAEISRFEAIINDWDESQRGVVAGLKRAIDTLHKTALTRLIKSMKAESLPALKDAVQDEIVYGVLLYHQLVKPPIQPLETRLNQALEKARVYLQSHGGDIALVAIKLPETVEVRFLGACEGCSSANLTLTNLVTEVIQASCPEIKLVKIVK